MTPRERARKCAEIFGAGFPLIEDYVESLTGLITTALQGQSNADLEQYRASKSKLISQIQDCEQTLDSLGYADHAGLKERIWTVVTKLHEERDALAAALDRMAKLAKEMAGYVYSYALDDRGPQSEWSRWSQCRNGIDNEANPSEILADRDRRMRTEGGREALRDLNKYYEDGCEESDSYLRQLTDTWEAK